MPTADTVSTPGASAGRSRQAPLMVRVSGGELPSSGLVLSMNLCCRSKLELPAEATLSTPLLAE